jgi:HD-like signal output (HDOD) protein
MMLRLGELLIGQRAPESLPEIEAKPSQAVTRWEREMRLFGFDECQVTAVLARHWSFPPAIVLGLQSASDPMAAEPFDALAGVVHLAARLADCPNPTPESVGELYIGILSRLDITNDWLVEHFPDPDKFVDVTAL